MNAKVIAAALLAASTVSVAGEVPIRKSGAMLVDGNGMTLYVYDKDTADKSACNGSCATAWPPAKAKATDKTMGDYSVVTRDDGSKQWAFKGKPLYTYAKDKAAGEKNGEGTAGWRVAASK